MKKLKLRFYKFSPSATEIAPDILRGGTPEQFLKGKYTRGCIFGLDLLQRAGIYQLSGWEYNFRPCLKRFLVKQYGSWSEYYAPNKTALRGSLYNRIEEIVEIPKKD